MRLFTFEGTPKENGSIDFRLIPSDDLEKELPPESLDELTRNVTEDFVSIIESNADLKDAGLAGHILRISLKMNDEGVPVVVDEETPAMRSFVKGLSAEGRAGFEKARDDVMRTISDQLGDYLEFIMRLE